MNTQSSQAQSNQESTEIGYLVNDQGEEIPITETMIENSLINAQDICLGSSEQTEEEWVENSPNAKQSLFYNKSH